MLFRSSIWHPVRRILAGPVPRLSAESPRTWDVTLPSVQPTWSARRARFHIYIDARDPPFLIQHGTADTSVSSKQAEKLHQALRAAGVDSKLILYPGVDHGFAKVGGGPDDAVNRRALEDVFDFLARFGS